MKPLTPIKRRFIFPTISFLFCFIISSLSIAALNGEVDAKKKAAATEELSKYQKPIYGPTSTFTSVDQYKSSPKEDPFAIAIRIDDMLGGLSANASALVEHPSITGEGLPVDMMTQADAVVGDARNTYTKMHAMYKEVAFMQTQAESKTQNLKADTVTSDKANQFNSATTDMSKRVASLRQSLTDQKEKLTLDKTILDGMPDVLDQMSQYGSEVLQYYDKFNQHIKDVSNRFESMNKDLKAQGLEASQGSEQARKYLSSLEDFVNKRKPFTSKEINYLKDVKTYLKRSSDYLNQTISNIEKSDKNLSDIQLFFINLKAHAGDKNGPLANLTPDAGGDYCAGVVANEGGMFKSGKPKPLMTKDACQKSCHSAVCREKAKAPNGEGCFECPSGSPDTCYDVGMLPADVSWCKPGGVCYDDPEMYCQPMGAIGPNKMPLNCTTCKQRNDECSQKLGADTTNLTHCEQTCAGECTYAGKYKNQEWDGKPEFMHCYKCKMPPGPPTCEDLGWGSTEQQMCMKNCPDGECRSRKISIGKDGKPFFDDKKADDGNPPAPGSPDNPGGNLDGGSDKPLGGPDGQTGAGGVANPQDDGKDPNPPTDGPAGSSGGGGSVAAGNDQPQGGDNKGGVTEPAKPNSTESKDPGAPNPADKPKPPEPPKDNPPTNDEIEFYKKWLHETEERIKSREDIINDKNEFDGVKDMARDQLAGMTKEKEKLEKRIKEEEDKERERLQKAEDEKKMREDYEKNRPQTPDFATQVRQRELEWKTKELKKATNDLQEKLQEARDAITGRKEHIDRINHDIDLLKKEDDYLKEAGKQGTLGADFVEKRIAENEKRIKDLTETRNELAKKLNETVRKYNEEINKLKSEYQRAYWQYNENARRKAEVERMNEYMEKYDDLRRAKEAKEIRDKAFDDFKASLQGELDRAKAAGDTSKADELQHQIDNLTRGKQMWDDQADKRISNLEEDLYQTGQRNFHEGAGPFSVENLGEKYDQYSKYVDQNIADVQKALSESKITQAQADEQLKALNDTKSQIAAQKDYYKNGNPFSQEDIDRIGQSAMKNANATIGMDEDKSFVRLFGESLAEEAVHNLNPLVAIKKSWAFGTGFVEGVYTGVKDVANMGWQAVKTVGQAALVDAGFENGGFLGTDNLDALASLGTTISENTNFDGLIKAVVAAGKAEDDLLKELGKGDIDKNTANFGGKVAGNLVGNELGGMAAGEIVGAAYDATKSTVKGLLATEKEIAAGTKVVDEAAEALNAGEKAASAEKKPPTVETEGKAPKGPEGEGAPTRGPPPEKNPPNALEYDNTKPLPDTGTKPKPLDDATLTQLEEKNGFRKDHAERMSEFAQEKQVYLIVRDGNPDSVKFFGNDDMLAKPMTSKAKTAKVGPDKGLVVDPTHPKQAGYWDQALADAEKAGDAEKLKKLTDARAKAVETWEKYGNDMLEHGYQVNPDTGVIEYNQLMPDGTTKTWKGIHGDYDLHGVYKANPEGVAEHVSFGGGNKLDANHFDTEGVALRQQLNEKITGGGKDFIQHGGQDDWIPDPSKVPNKPPDPPATVFFPDGRPPVRLNNAEEMRAFYEGTMGVKFPYPDAVPPGAPMSLGSGGTSIAGNAVDAGTNKQ